MWDPREDAWFAGFADGEGCFLISLSANPRWGRPCVLPRFSLGLRADERPVLSMLAGAFGGKLSFDPRPQGRASRPANPRYIWHVVTKAHMLNLVAYFDRFPLRAKKARDYAIWREAAFLYAAHGGADAFDELLTLREALMAGRAYDASIDSPELADAPQLRLLREGG